MIRSRHHAPGTAPATLVTTAEARPAVITLIEYDAAGIEERRIERIEDVFHCREDERVSWINIDGLGDVELLRTIGAHFGLHPLALEDVLNTTHRPKIEEYSDHLFVITRMASVGAEEMVEFEQVSMFLGKNFLITIQERPGDVFEAVRQRLRGGRGYARKMRHDYLLYALLDALVDHFFPVLEKLGEEIETLEDVLLESPSRSCVARLHDIKRSLLHLRRAAWPEREVMSALNRDESGLIAPETKVFLRDCYDHTISIMDVIESYRDVTAGMMDLYLSSVSNRTNEVMRVLTVIASIFIPLTFIAGVYGMNFDPEASPWNMPELGARYGYPICVAVMLVLGIGMVVFFRKKGWL